MFPSVKPNWLLRFSYYLLSFLNQTCLPLSAASILWCFSASLPPCDHFNSSRKLLNDSEHHLASDPKINPKTPSQMCLIFHSCFPFMSYFFILLFHLSFTHCAILAEGKIEMWGQGRWYKKIYILELPAPSSGFDTPDSIKESNTGFFPSNLFWE